MLILKGILIVIAVFVLGDFIYSRVVAYRYRQWESTIRRDEDGVREGCHAFELGSGDDALLLVHGINDSPHFYYKMAPRLADAGFACHGIRLPGFAQPNDVYAKAKKVDWVRAVAEKTTELRDSHERVFIVAHSLGGAITIRHLLDHPDAVDGVVLLAPGIRVSSDRSPILTVRAWHEISRFTLLFTNLTESPFGIDAQDPEEANSPYRTPFTPKAIIRETFTLFDQNRPRADEFQTPMLLILAAHDHVIDNDAAREFYATAPASPKSLIEIPTAAHALAVDYGWEEVADHIVDFVQSSP